MTTLIEALHAAARDGDWDRLDALCAELPLSARPETEREISDYLFQLRTILIAAKTSRADLVKSLHRLTAASAFNLSA